MNNYMVILENYNYILIQVDTDMETVIEVLTKYISLRKSKLYDKSIIDYFNSLEYKAKDFFKTKESIYDTFMLKNYRVIDLSDLISA